VRKVLIVSPHFPPVNAPDMQRVRLSLGHFAKFGWQPIVLAVDPKYVEGATDPLLLGTIPASVCVKRTAAFSPKWTRRIGVGDLGVRSFPFLKRTGDKLLAQGEIDLIYFSTTVFTSMALGRIWKEHFGVPFVLDMQDPWATDYYRDRPAAERPPKYWFADRVHRTLEPWTMKQADGIVAVSTSYIETLQERYPRLRQVPTLTLPFGAAPEDLDFVRDHPQPNRFFQPGDGLLHGVYVGRGGADMAAAAKVLFGALKLGLQENPKLFGRTRLHFIGTSYAPDHRAAKTIEPLAEPFGVAEHVSESTRRVPYFEALQLLLDADFLVVPGSDDPQYTASKIYPYILSKKPMMALFRDTSSVCDVLRSTGAGILIPVTSDAPADQRLAYCAWTRLLAGLPCAPPTNWESFKPYLAQEMTRQQCDLFGDVLERGR
jgi:hypothetical protein